MLFSIFVLFVGIWGLATIIDLGRTVGKQSEQADRAGACGRAALRDVKVRRMVDPYPWASTPTMLQWVGFDNGGSQLPATTVSGNITTAGAFALDPLGVNHYLINPTSSLLSTMGAITGSPGIPRLTLGGTLGTALSSNVMEPIFVCQDDKIFDLPADVNLRTKGQFLHPNGTMDDNPLNPDGTAATPANEGAYSWLMTVVPNRSELAVSLSSTSTFQVSVAVCHRRNYNTNSAQGLLGEQVATATFLGGVGIGGGSVQLTDPTSGNPAYVSVKENQWVLLLGSTQCKWYRVVATGDNPTNMLTLAGPDWDTTLAPTATIVIIDSVIGVYSTTIELDRGSPWTQ